MVPNLGRYRSRGSDGIFKRHREAKKPSQSSEMREWIQFLSFGLVQISLSQFQRGVGLELRVCM